VRLVSKHGDWTLYESEGAARVCFISSEPRDSEPKGASRDVIHFYISGWPTQNVASEISIKIGYNLKRGSDVNVTVGNSSFKLFAADDRAFVANAEDEGRLLDALRKGNTMTVQGTSERGTVTKDTFSLAGVSSALQSMTTACQ
jgi:invasion protein IalB